MANTRRGKKLTTEFYQAQKHYGALGVALAREHWDMLDPNDLDATAPAWIRTQVAGTRLAHDRAIANAREYVQQYQEAETGTTPLTLPPAAALDEHAVAEKLRVNGPIAVKQAIGRGVDIDLAMKIGLSRVQGETLKGILDGGRKFVIDAAYHDGRAKGWRRVTRSARPCAFCAMLAGRGPVYKGDTVTFKPHGYCNCVAEIVYGPWEPSQRERLWRAAYLQAAGEADDLDQPRVAPHGDQREDTILWRMRRNNPQLFRDGVWPLDEHGKSTRPAEYDR